MAVANTLFDDLRINPTDNTHTVCKKQALLLEQAAGKHGFEVIADTAAHTGQWSSVEMLEETVIASISGDNISETSLTCPSGFKLLGAIDALTLTSGSLVAYHSRSEYRP